MNPQHHSLPGPGGCGDRSWDHPQVPSPLGPWARGGAVGEDSGMSSLEGIGSLRVYNGIIQGRLTHPCPSCASTITYFMWAHSAPVATLAMWEVQ